MLDEDPSLMAKRETLAKRLDLYKSARDEIDSVAWKWSFDDSAATQLRGNFTFTYFAN